MAFERLQRLNDLEASPRKGFVVTFPVTFG